jgi:uncharacterized protein YjiK
MNRPQGKPGSNPGEPHWSWICLTLLGALAAATLGDALQINGRLRQAAGLLVGYPENDPSSVQSNSGYSAVLQRHPVAGLPSPQGLTYNADTRTLFTVVENEQAIAELDLCGTLLRRITVKAAHPLEEVTALSDGHLLLSFANTNTISLLTLPADAASADSTTGLQLDVREGTNQIEAEEIAWDSKGQRLFLASKEYPPRIYQARFNLNDWRNRRRGTHRLQTNEWLASGRILSFMPDITALAYSEPRGELLLLSDETRDIVAVSEGAQPRKYLDLNKGSAGLEEKIRSPEGMAIASDASIYLISDPAEVFLYRFFPETGLSRQSLCPIR